MPVRQLSKPSVAASASSSSDTATSTTRILATSGESASGAVGSSTTISISVLDMGLPEGEKPMMHQSRRSSAKSGDPAA
jgi:hypothetical protein